MISSAFAFVLTCLIVFSRIHLASAFVATGLRKPSLTRTTRTTTVPAVKKARVISSMEWNCGQGRGKRGSRNQKSSLVTAFAASDTDTTFPVARDETTGPYHVAIEYCTGCKWGLRSFWLAQEILSTFRDDPSLAAVTLTPSRPPAPGGTFTIRCRNLGEETATAVTLWDRKERDGFPEPKELKQILRDVINPAKFLGRHSETEDRLQQHQQQEDETVTVQSEAMDASRGDDEKDENSDKGGGHLDRAVLLARLSPGVASIPNVVVEFCTGCGWMLRAAYLGQELFSTFDDGEIASVTLLPSRPSETNRGGRFAVSILEGTREEYALLWDRETMGGFPQTKVLKQRIRDVIAPSKNLGHSDVQNDDSDDNEKSNTSNDQSTPSKETKTSSEAPAPFIEMMDDDEAEEARKFFGVS